MPFFVSLLIEVTSCRPIYDAYVNPSAYATQVIPCTHSTKVILCTHLSHKVIPFTYATHVSPLYPCPGYNPYPHINAHKGGSFI